MSYKHNNLMAMRENYWNELESEQVTREKQFFQHLLLSHDIFPHAGPDEAKYLFFSLPSIIIVKGYALGFEHQTVERLIQQYILRYKAELQQKHSLKIQYKMQ